jgi:hypothetical protein
MDKAGLLDLLLLPLRWLEQSSGWRRRTLALLYLSVITASSVLAWRELYLWQLPNLREPFDEAKYGLVELAESENAQPIYQAAIDLLPNASSELKRVRARGRSYGDWSQIDPAYRRWVESSRSALEVWLKAADRSDFVFVQPKQRKFTTPNEMIQAIHSLARLGILEAARRMESGDLEAAWVYYRAVLRTSRHVGRHGDSTQRMTGQLILRQAQAPIHVWINHPSTTPVLLRKAIVDIEACKALTMPLADLVRVEYFAARDLLDHPEAWKEYDSNGAEAKANWYVRLPWFGRVRHYLNREPERSQRVLRLVTVGLLAQCDRPRWVRAKLFAQRDVIHGIDNKTLSAITSISAMDLTGWAKNSAFRLVSIGQLPQVMSLLEFDRIEFDDICLQMAERAYQLEHGQPAQTYAELLGSYLKELPEGIESEDPIGASSYSR